MIMSAVVLPQDLIL